MTVLAFTGGAGCGKTHQLMQALSTHLETIPLKDGQKVLALTFMHGSRRRIEERLNQLENLKRRTECSTIDSFAWRLVRRWSTLASKLGFTNIGPDEYERVCDAAGELLQIKEVCGWIATTFPILLVDEAQDLTVSRLRIIQGLASRLEVFVAADEFQCLKEELRPNPACTWLNQVCQVQELTRPRRTNIIELLDAAAAIRRGDPPKSGKAFMIQLTSTPALAGAWLNSNLQWYCGGKSVAVITPTFGSFAKETIAWASSHRTKNGSGPYTVYWEESDSDASDNLLDTIDLQEMNDIPSVTTLLTATGDFRAARHLTDWMNTQRRTRGKTIFSKHEIVQIIKQGFSQRRRTRNGNENGWRGLTVHGAKNREFDNVIVLWPAAIGGSDDQKRRLLYNAITRAKKRCLVLVQAKAHLRKAPFAH